MRSIGIIPFVFLIAGGLFGVATVGAAEDHDHGHDHAHGDAGDHGHAEGHEPFATFSLDGGTFAVFPHGEAAPGGDLPIKVRLLEGRKGQPPPVLEAWVGVRSARGSTKARLDARPDGDFHGHLPMPEQMPSGAEIWFASIGPDNDVEQTSVAMPDTDHEHEHDHPAE